jgi:predicted nucleic-acid-binding protein
VRITVEDNPSETQRALKLLEDAEQIVISAVTLCEFVWVLSRTYTFGRTEIIGALKAIRALRNVVLDQVAFESGFRLLESGSDFADGVIAHEAQRMGADTFCSFDRKAVRIIEKFGPMAARIPK